MSETGDKPVIQTKPSANGAATVPAALDLQLRVTDAEVIAELIRHDEGPDRDDFAHAALRLGVLALRQASGFVDAEVLRTEGVRLLGDVEVLLTDQLSKTTGVVTEFAKKYLDPTDGQLVQRLDRLVRDGGDIEQVLTRHLDGETSTITIALKKHIGPDSPLIRMLSPDASDGLVAAIGESVDSAIAGHRAKILTEFSLDRPDSALCRLLKQITDRNGELRDDLREDVEKLKSEFSLDVEDSALSRLLRTINDAHQSVTREFSLDDKDSALSRMLRLIEATKTSVQSALTLDDEQSPLSILRRELLEVIQDGASKNAEFQKEIRTAVDTLIGRREESARGTAHGLDFEAKVGQVVADACARLCDAFEETGSMSGAISRCKVGDFVVTLGADSAAPNARVVVEAKEDKSYSVTSALAELDTARRNRDASVGIFVFSQKTAPAGIDCLSRHGDNVLVVWDSNDPTTDAFLHGAIMVARALAVKIHTDDASVGADLAEMDKAINAIAKDAEALDEIMTWANTVRSSGEKIHDKAERIRKRLGKQLETLREHLEALRS